MSFYETAKPSKREMNKYTDSLEIKQVRASQVQKNGGTNKTGKNYIGYKKLEK